jgi:hypothetical protein
MPFIAPKSPPPATFQLTLGPAVGKADDFWALAYCPEADELEKETNNPQHTQFTYVLHYELPRRTLIGRVPRRIDALWQQSDGTILAVGEGLGYLEITAAGMTEVALANVPGIFSCLWGADDDHVFAAGMAPAFALYRRHRSWVQLPLPGGTAGIRDVRGVSEREVYFVGDEGQIHLFDGQQVTRLRAPVRRHLTGIARLDRSRMCVSGYQGTLMVGSRAGWRHLITNTTEPLLTLAALHGRAYYGADDEVWSTDGVSPPTPVLSFPARWISGLTDALVLSHENDAKLYSGGTLVDLDLVV